MTINNQIIKKKQDYIQGNKATFFGMRDEAFEELVVDLYKKEIETKKYLGIFEDALLTPAGKDRGQDGILLYDNKQVGVIQCKCEKSPVNRKKGIDEVLKFLLYTVEDPTLFTPLEKKPFNYIFASAMGFSNIDQLAKFPSFAGHKDLEKHIKDVLKKNPSIKFDLNSSEQLNILNDRIRRTKVTLLGQKELDSLVRKHEDIIPEYFNVSDSIVRRYCETRQNIDTTQILEDLTAASQALCNFRNKFGTFHLKRTITGSIYHWIRENNSDHNIAIVSGKPGCGKTTIMRELYEQCKQENITTLALKADSQSGANETQLKENINLSTPIVDALRQMASKGLTVLLIDQLDALSRNFTRDCSQIRTYLSIINKLKMEKKIKIIISTREYDLESDDSLIHLTNNRVKRFCVEELSDEDLQTVFEGNNLPFHDFHPSLIRILKRPIYLSLYLELIKTGEITQSSDTLTPLSLYHKLHHHILLKANDREKTNRLLYRIASSMFEEAQLALRKSKYEIEFPEVLPSLISEGILHDNKGQITFFHQTFFEYIYIQYIIYSNISIVDFIRLHKQSPRIRTILSIFIEQMIEDHPSSYIGTINEILWKDEFGTHIKNLVYYHLGSRMELSRKEKDIIEKLSHYPILFIPLLQACRSKLLASHILSSQLLYNVEAPWCNSIKVNFIATHLDSNIDEAISYIQSKPDIFTSEVCIGLLCWKNRDWNNEKLWEFTISLAPIFHFSNRQHIRLINNIIQTHSEKISTALLDKNSILQVFEEKDNSLSYIVHKALENLLEKYPNKYVAFITEVLDQAVNNSRQDATWYRPHQYWEDYIFKDYIPSCDKESNKSYWMLMNSLLKALIKQAELESPSYESFYEKFRSSDSYTWNTVMGYIFSVTNLVNEDRLIYMLQRALERKEFGSHKTLHHQYWNIIRNKFHLCSPLGQLKLLNIISSISLDYESSRLRSELKRSGYPYFRYTMYIYLDAIPKEALKNFPKYQRLYGELFRKHGIISYNWEKGITAAHLIGPPLKKSAYEFMQDEEWIKSFRKFNDHCGRRHVEGGIYQHSQAFEESCKNNPARYLPLVKQITSEKSISIEYKIRGLNGIIEGKYFIEDTLSISLQLINSTTDIEKHFLLTYMLKNLVKAFPTSNSLFEIVKRLLKKSVQISEVKNETLRHDCYACDTKSGVCSALIYFSETPIFQDQVFEELEHLIQLNHPSYRLTILRLMPYLIKADKERALNIFLKCSNNIDERTISFALGSISYFDWALPQLEPFYLEAMKVCKEHDHIRALTIYLSHLTLDQDNTLANKLLKKALKSWGIEADATLIEVALANSYVSTFRDTCIQWLRSYLNRDETEIRDAFSLSFLRYGTSNERKASNLRFNVLLPFLRDYVVSPCFKPSNNHFFDFLIENIALYHEEILELVCSMTLSVGESPFIIQYDYKKWLRILLSTMELSYKEEMLERATCQLNKILDIIDDPLEAESILNTINQSIN